MAVTFNFGNGRTFRLSLDSSDCTILAPECAENAPLDDPATAMRQALAEPLGYPPLASATVPGDRVALAVEDGVPQADELIRGAIAAIVDSGIEPADVTVVSATALDGLAELQSRLDVAGVEGVHFLQHNPDDQRQTAMVGVTSSGFPLRVNRKLVDADFLLPIGVARAALAPGDNGAPYAGLFPEFSDRDTVERLRASGGATMAPRRRGRPADTARSAQLAEAGWLLGIQLEALVVPGAAGRAAAVLAGAPSVVADAAGRRYRAVWERPRPAPAELVILAIAGDAREQSWDDVRRALGAAERVLAPGGAIAICSELAERPGRSLNRLRGATDFGRTQRDLARDATDDAATALALAEALDRGPVYLHSRLSRDAVESLGMTPLEGDAELSRLAGARGRCIVIEESQRTIPI